MKLNEESLIDIKSLYSDTTPNFINPAEPKVGDDVEVLFRTAASDVSKVYLVCGSKRIEMQIYLSDELFDYYRAVICTGKEKIRYFFEITRDAETVFFDARGPVVSPEEHFSFQIIPGFSTPNWAKGAVMYQIYTDRFCNGDETNDVEDGEYFYIDATVNKVKDWNKYPEVDGTKEFYGGDLQGVINKLPYLKSLGIEVIYFNPLFVSPSNHKYDIQDYDYIDPHFGVIVEDGGEALPLGAQSNADATKFKKRVTSLKNLEASNNLFAELISKAHECGIKVIIDGVFNHCGSFNKWMDAERIYEEAKDFEKGAFISKDSPYNSYFDFSSNNWPYNSDYAGWWDYKTLPKLNYEGSKDLENYILKIAKKWVSKPFCADGWRLDVAADLGHSPEYNHYFWQQFRKAVKEANPEAIILAEHYGDTSYWLGGNEWDSVMNYDAFMEPVTWFLTGMEKHSDSYNGDLHGNDTEFWNMMYRNTSNFSYPSMSVAMNELSNHDHSRFMSRTSGKVGRTGTLGADAADRGNNRAVFMAGVVMQMTWVGAPTIYYGDEAGVCGFTDPDNRRTYPWGREDHELIAFHKDIIRMRKQHTEFKSGSIKRIESERDFLCYGRFNRVGKGKSLVLINMGEEKNVEICVTEIGAGLSGVMRTLISTNEREYLVGGPEYEIENGKIQVAMRKKECLVLSLAE